MTVGERIQMYRKQFGMSQEELGQKLLVSRQTISLWEKDQTVPTIANLVRLKEIFGVSVDDILGINVTEQNSGMLPYETYRFRFVKEELSEIRRLQRKAIYKKPLVLTLLCVLLTVLLICLSSADGMIGFAFGLLFAVVISHIKGIRAYNKVWKNNEERICKSTYEYQIFDDYISINIFRENEKVRASKYFFTDIEKIQLFDRWLLLQIGGQIFIIRKGDLKETSAFYSYANKISSNPPKDSRHKCWIVLSKTLFVASLLSIFGALVLVAVVSGENHLFLDENMWLFFLFTPIPIASVVLGFVLKAKNYKYKKNIIAGIIMVIFLCAYGSFSFIFADVYDHSDEPIVRAERTVGIDIPDHKKISTQDWTKGTQSVSRGYIYSTSDIYFDDAAVEEFEKQLADDERWLPAVSSDMIGITSPIYDNSFHDYILIYNVDTSEYNTLPSNSGNFRFINVLYRLEENQMEIVEYDIDCVK